MGHYKIIKRVPNYLSEKHVPSRKLGKSYMVLRPGIDGEWEEFGRRYTVKGIVDFVGSHANSTDLDICKEVYLDIVFEEWRRNFRKNRRFFKV